jgi:MFS family permease
MTFERAPAHPVLGVRANLPQFSLLVLVNAFVGGMVGIERSILPTLAHEFKGFAAGAVLLGLGTAMVYPTLLASIGDVAHPSWRGSAVGVYRLWRDLGYAFGAIIAGLVADTFGLTAAVYVVAVITFLSGSVVAARMSETLHQK